MKETGVKICQMERQLDRSLMRLESQDRLYIKKLNQTNRP